MTGKYILDGKTPVPCEDLMEWARWFETANRHIASDELKHVAVSTVFLGLDHSFGGGGQPTLFETMVFHNGRDIDCIRSASWDEAETQHKRLVKKWRDKRPSAEYGEPVSEH